LDSTLDDGGTEGPDRGAKARSAGAPRGWGLGRGAVEPPEKFSKINIEIAYFSAFLMVSSAVAESPEMQD